jgi:hypothetical protein
MAMQEISSSGDVKIFGGFTSTLNVEHSVTAAAALVEAEMNRRGVRFLPQQVIRRLLNQLKEV